MKLVSDFLAGLTTVVVLVVVLLSFPLRNQFRRPPVAPTEQQSIDKQELNNQAFRFVKQGGLPNSDTGIQTTATSSNTTARQQWRQRRLANVCSRMSVEEKTKQPDWSEFLVDDKRRYIYCKVEKAACTSWKRTLLMLTGKIRAEGPTKLGFNKVHGDFTYQYIKPLSFYKPDEIRTRLRTYYKFMFVREPLERLVSAYRDKIVRDPQYKGLRRRVIRNFGHGREKSFAAFIKFLLPKTRRRLRLDIHWRRQYEICRPCYVNYDFIGHYETLYDDADYVVNAIAPKEGRGSKVKFPRTDPDNKHKKSSYFVEDMYSQLTSEIIHRLCRFYSLDYKMFGFTPNVYCESY